jgi:integrase
MAVKKNRSERLLKREGNVWWFRKGIPKRVHQIIKGRKFAMVNLGPVDLAKAKEMRTEIEAAALVQFDEVLTGKRKVLELPYQNFDNSSSTGLPPAARGEIIRQAMEAAKEADDNEELALISEAAEAEACAMRPAARKLFEDAIVDKVEVERYLEAYLKAAELAPKTTAERRGLVLMFARWCADKGKKLYQIDRRLAGRYVSEQLEHKHSATQAKHITALRQYWIYLARRGHVELPTGETVKTGWPWNDQRIEKRGKRVERGAKKDVERPFRDSEVFALLNQPFPLKSEWKALMQDVLKVSLLSGMRQAEILTLWVEEVVEMDGHLYFDIQQGKTEAAARMVPVHSSLLPMIRVRIANKAGQDMLFNELASNKNPSDAFGKRFKRFREALGVDEKRDGVRRSLVNFHSARRWFATKARYAGQPKDTIADVIGHRPDKQDVTFGRYARGASTAQLRACVEAVQLEVD